MEANPYTPPNTEISSDDSAWRKRGRWTARIGVTLFTGPIWGMMGTVMGMLRAFNTLDGNGAGSAGALSDGVGFALVSTMIGIAVGLVGSVLVLIALFAMKNREKWFFWWSVLLSVFWCLVIFPYGMIVGLPILILFLVQRAEFANRTSASQVAPSDDDKPSN